MNQTQCFCRSGVIISLAIFAIVAVRFGLSFRPRIDVFATIENNNVVFNIPFSGINGLLLFQVDDGDDEPLWKIDMSYEQGHKIVYGVLPTTGNMAPHQISPAAGVEMPHIRGKRVVVRVQYQYDRPFAPCTDEFRKVVVVP